MTPTDYIFVFYSFILALAVAEVLQGIGQMLYPRSEAMPSGIHAIWISALLLAIVSFWWAMWEWRSIERWTAVGFLVQGAGVLLLFLMTFLSFPRDVRNVDLTDYYFEITPKVWGMLAVYFLIVMLSVRLVRGLPWTPTELDAANAFGAVLSLALARSRRPMLHWIGLSLFGLTGLTFMLFALPAIS